MVLFCRQIVDRIDDRFVTLMCRHERDEDAAVGGHKNKTGQTPGASQESNRQFAVRVIAIQRPSSETPFNGQNHKFIIRYQVIDKIG